MTTEATSSPDRKKLALVICSTRKPRAGPSIASLIMPHLSSQDPNIDLSILDLADHPLPLFDEPLPPSEIKDPSLYAHAHTRAWSEIISPISGFIFLTPQYNWSIPAVLKNCIDFLYHEWKGKPVLVVSYGSRGGGKAAVALKEVCRGVRMDVMDQSIALTLDIVEGGLKRAAREGALEKGFVDAWEEELNKLGDLFEQLTAKVQKSNASTSG